MTDDLIDFLKGIIFVFCLFLLIAIPVFSSINYFVYRSCLNYSEVTGRATVYKHFDSCFVQTPQGYQRWDEYKNRAIASEGLKNK